VETSKLRHPTVDRPRIQTRPPSKYAQKEGESKPQENEDSSAIAPWQKEMQKKKSASSISKVSLFDIK
jgi:hypothetical protein